MIVVVDGEPDARGETARRLARRLPDAFVVADPLGPLTPLERAELPLQRHWARPLIVANWALADLATDEQRRHVRLLVAARGGTIVDAPDSDLPSARDAVPLVNDVLRSYVGSARPGVLLLGDRWQRPRACWHSAFVPFPATSGTYLLRALATLDWDGYGLANANHRHATATDLGEAWRTLGQPAVVALGHAAHTAVHAAEIPHGVCPHPQFVRRFHHAAAGEYAEQILKCADLQDYRLDWRPDR